MSRHELCGAMWPNRHLPDLPHRCAVRVGWHITHMCHCGDFWKVSDDEQVDNAQRAARDAAGQALDLALGDHV